MTKKLLISILFSVFAFYAIADLQDNPCEHDEIVPDVPENKVETDCNFTLSLDYKGETTIYIPVNTGNPEVSPTLDGETGKVEIMGHCEDCEDAGFVDETIYHNLKYEWSSNDESGEDSSCSGITRDEIGSDSISFTVNCDDCGHSASSEPLTLEFYKIDLIAPDIEEENEDKDLGLVVSLNNNFDEGLVDTDGTTPLSDYSN